MNGDYAAEVGGGEIVGLEREVELVAIVRVHPKGLVRDIGSNRVAVAAVVSSR